MAKTPLTHAAHDHHVQPVYVYVFTLLALIVLMFATIAASYIEIPSIGPISGNVLNNLLAVGIASVKAILVILFFMHVKYSTSLTKMWVLIGFTWLTLLTITLGDYGTRKFEPVPNWTGKPESALPRTQLEENVPPDDPLDVNVRPRP